MLLSRISGLLKDQISTTDFKKDIENEISEYKKNISKKGASSAIILTEDASLTIKIRDVDFLCSIFLRDQIDKWELNYLAEAILLSKRVGFESRKAVDALSALADPEYFKLVDHKYIEQVLFELHK